jgi:cobalt-zinc-cadmium efflux system protein
MITNTTDSSRSRRRGQRRVLWIALAANGLLLGGELAAGLLFRSLTLLADAVHLLTDVSGLAIAILVLRLMDRPATLRHSFGLQRGEVLAAQANALVLLGASAWIFVEAARRLANPVHVSGTGLLAVASVGLVVNLGSAWLLQRRSGESLNMRGAFLHLASDAVGSLGAMIAGAVIIGWDIHRADPAISILIGVLVVWAAVRLLAETMHVLLEGAPKGFDPKEIESALAGEQGVDSVHHLHLWSLASDTPALSAHVVLSSGRGVSIHDAQQKADQMKAMLTVRFGIDHATLEVECHAEHPSAEHR